MAETLRQTDPASGHSGPCATRADRVRPLPLHRPDPRRGHGPHGHRPRPGVFRPSAWRAHPGHLLHPLDHALLRPGLHLPGRDQRVPLRPPSSGPPALPAPAWALAGAARADRDPGGVDLQPRFHRVPARRGHLDDRLVHGADGRPGAASGGAGGWAWRRHHRAPQRGHAAAASLDAGHAPQAALHRVRGADRSGR